MSLKEFNSIVEEIGEILEDFQNKLDKVNLQTPSNRNDILKSAASDIEKASTLHRELSSMLSSLPPSDQGSARAKISAIVTALRKARNDHAAVKQRCDTADLTGAGLTEVDTLQFQQRGRILNNRGRIVAANTTADDMLTIANETANMTESGLTDLRQQADVIQATRDHVAHIEGSLDTGAEIRRKMEIRAKKMRWILIGVIALLVVVDVLIIVFCLALDMDGDDENVTPTNDGSMFIEAFGEGEDGTIDSA